MMECDALDSVRVPLLKLMENVDEDFKQKTKEQKTSTILAHTCYNYHILNCITYGFIVYYVLELYIACMHCFVFRFILLHR